MLREEIMVKLDEIREADILGAFLADLIISESNYP